MVRIPRQCLLPVLTSLLRCCIKFSKNKQYTGQSIWALAMTILCSLKKAISLVPKVSPTIAMIDKSCAIIQYASGWTEASFHQYINNGMYEMSKSEENRGENAELMQTSACASLAGSLADVDNGSDFNKREKNEVIDLADICLEDWNPFNGITAPAGYAYCGKLAFMCLGPASKFYCKIHKTGGGNAKNKEERGKNACSSICKVQEEMAAMEHVVCSERGMSVQTKVSLGFLAQNEDNAARYCISNHPRGCWSDGIHTT